MQVAPTIIQITPIISQFWHELVFTVLIGIIGTAAMWPIRKVKKAYDELKTAIGSTHAELVIQRSNCLKTLQDQGDRQINLLEKVSDTLSSIHLDQRQLLGKLDK